MLVFLLSLYCDGVSQHGSTILHEVLKYMNGSACVINICKSMWHSIYSTMSIYTDYVYIYVLYICCYARFVNARKEVSCAFPQIVVEQH